MHTPVQLLLWHRLVRGLAYLLFQVALLLAFLLRSVGALRFPVGFHSAAEDRPATPHRVPGTHLKPRPAL